MPDVWELGGNNESFHWMGAISKTLYVQICMEINSKIHFIIMQSIMHINLTANVKY